MQVPVREAPSVVVNNELVLCGRVAGSACGGRGVGEAAGGW